MMEKHKCKYCYRSFSNGRALGGHMRSHMMNLPIPPKPNDSPPSPSPPPPPPPTIQLSFEAESDSSPSSSSLYSLRENPKRSFIFTDPNQFIDAGSIILQQESETETETESSKNPTRPRSKRVRKLDTAKPNDSVLSSSSDITTEEDIAFCLMLLSRDNNNNWRSQTHTQTQTQRQQHNYHDQDHEQLEQHHYYVDEDEDDADADVEVEEIEEEEESEAESEEELKPMKKVRGRYKCDTCNKVFRSYQALGGHRASHKKTKQLAGDSSSQHDEKINIENINVNINVNVEKKIHECPVCFREFASGQALGGHKRTHGIGTSLSAASAPTSTTTIAAVTASAAAATNVEVVVRSSAKFGDSLLDLNLPAPMDDGDGDGGDEGGSAVSDS
ncbi:zinc finger protein ZAT9-like [Vicia villosa]|uniref:zinc finger protein ZAT9-like n=1 Tax=Vicia villosa TaxID=3911 RepID=UPI00273AD782|nr:zinc finger protein ZAT9-like [Vicia villosa]